MSNEDFEALEPRRFLPSAVGHTFGLTAEFEDLAAVRRAHRALREAGIADDRIVVLGQLGEEVSTDWGLCADERVVISAISWRIAIGAGLGALAGGILSLLAGLIALGTGSDLWAAVLPGAVFGAGAGGVIGGVTGTRVVFSSAELHRGHPEFEHALIGIHDDSPADVARAATILRGLAAVRIETAPATVAAS